MEQLTTLVDQIEHHNHLYWNQGTPEISDPEYDSLVNQLAKINPDHPLLQKVYAPKVSTSGKVEHAVPMLSLDKVHTEDALIAWAAKYARSEEEKFSFEPKLDGISTNFDGKIIASRGDGFVGENLTHHVPTIKVHSKKYKGSLQDCTVPIRGEIVISYAEFRSNQDILVRGSNGKPYKIPRSAVSGILNNDEIKPELSQILTLVDFDAFSSTFTLAELRTKDWVSLVETYKNRFQYPIDGMVLKLADQAYSDSLGSTSHHPRGQVAYKLGNPKGETVLLGVKWQAGKHSLSPVGIVKSVDIEGITNSRITLHNYEFIQANDLAVGDVIVIERCNEIIPGYFETIEKPENRIPIEITSCPACGGEIVIDMPEVRCINDDCCGKLLQKLCDAVTRIGINSLGEPTVQKMMDMYRVSSLIDIFNLSEDQICQLPGFAEKSAFNVYSEIQNVKSLPVEDWRILASINIRGVGERLGRQIMSKLTISELRSASVEQLVSLEGISDLRANLLIDKLNANAEYLDQMLNLLQVEETKRQEGESVENQQFVCFTGKSETPRKEWIKLAESNGFLFDSSVKQTTNLLVTHDPGSSSSKMKKAAKYGVKVLTYEEFMALIK